ncbi:PilE-like protein [Elusimicrobium minutum Pei191]|uniref:PilE-like protein n=1 Tax=Elusimicrobium minutum (strain Pei191) TaxID=445932 RepID=B2KDQ3_ELUMP|nr:PilE-like protein [Elusimicrobium minutum Pei191]
MKKGFTLIELLVVVLIIGILAAIALPQYNKTVEKSRATEAFINLKAMADAEEIYFMQTGEYTSDFADLDIEMQDSPRFKYYSDYPPSYIAASRSSNYYYNIEVYLQNPAAAYQSMKGKRICKTNGNPNTKEICNSLGCESWSSDGTYCILR